MIIESNSVRNGTTQLGAEWRAIKQYTPPSEGCKPKYIILSTWSFVMAGLIHIYKPACTLGAFVTDVGDIRDDLCFSSFTQKGFPKYFFN